MYRKNVAGQFLYFALVNATTGAALTGATVAGKRGIDGAAQASITGTITEDAGGQYHIALSQADTNGNDIGYLFTATSAIPVSISVVTTAADPTDGVHFGLTCLPNTAVTTNASLLTSGVGTDQLSVATGRIDAGKWLGGTIPAVNVTGVPLVDLKYTLGTISPATAGSVRADAVTGAVGSVTGSVGSVTGAVGSVTGNVGGAVGSVTGAVGSVTGNVGGNVVGSVASVTAGVSLIAGQLFVKKNTQITVTFPMTDSTTHLPKTGVIVTAQRSIDGAAVAACANAATELSLGLYSLVLAAADTNGAMITLILSGAASDTRFIGVVTQA